MKAKVVLSSKASAKPKKIKKTFQCGVCLDSKPFRTEASLTCGHSFCKKCITSWAKTETSCPFCRATFRSYSYRGKIVAIRSRRRRTDHGELFENVVNATTLFLESADYQSKLLDELIERKTGIEMLILFIHRGLRILSEEGNRENFDSAKLFDAMTASENLVRLIRSRSIMV